MIFLKKYKNYHVLINWLNFSALYLKKIANDCLKKNQKKIHHVHMPKKHLKLIFPHFASFWA